MSRRAAPHDTEGWAREHGFDTDDAAAADIRAWGNARGWDVGDYGRLPADLRSAYYTAHAGQAAAPAPREPDDDDSGPAGPVVFSVPIVAAPSAGEGDGEPTAAGPAAEQPPQAPGRPGLRERVRRARRPRDSEPGAGRKRAPGRPRKRVSWENLAGALWAGVARGVAYAGGERMAPVANLMAFEAPVAGLVLEDAVRGTVVDRAVQPVLRVIEGGTDASYLLGGPLVVGGVCAGVIPYPVGRVMLAQVLKGYIVMAGPRLREVREREERFAAEMAAMGGEFAVPGPDGQLHPMTLDDIIDSVFAPLLAHSNGHMAGAPAGMSPDGQPG